MSGVACGVGFGKEKEDRGESGRKERGEEEEREKVHVNHTLFVLQVAFEVCTKYHCAYCKFLFVVVLGVVFNVSRMLTGFKYFLLFDPFVSCFLVCCVLTQHQPVVVDSKSRAKTENDYI